MGRWRQLLESAMASHQHLAHSKYCQLATTRLDGTPSNRTVVFRGFVQETDNLLFATDSRTRKVQEIEHCPVAEVCYYFTESWEQFRIHGNLELIGSQELDPSKKLVRENAWFSSSIKARKQYLNPHPGQPRTANDYQPPSGDDDDLECPLDTFCVLTLQAEEVDYVNLKENRRLMFRAAETGCSEEEVNP